MNIERDADGCPKVVNTGHSVGGEKVGRKRDKLWFSQNVNIIYGKN